MILVAPFLGKKIDYASPSYLIFGEKKPLLPWAQTKSPGPHGVSETGSRGPRRGLRRIAIRDSKPRGVYSGEVLGTEKTRVGGWMGSPTWTFLLS